MSYDCEIVDLGARYIKLIILIARIIAFHLTRKYLKYNQN